MVFRRNTEIESQNTIAKYGLLRTVICYPAPCRKRLTLLRRVRVFLAPNQHSVGAGLATGFNALWSRCLVYKDIYPEKEDSS